MNALAIFKPVLETEQTYVDVTGLDLVQIEVGWTTRLRWLVLEEKDFKITAESCVGTDEVAHATALFSELALHTADENTKRH